MFKAVQLLGYHMAYNMAGYPKIRRRLVLVFICILSVLVAGLIFQALRQGSQVQPPHNDPNFDASVENPAYIVAHATVFIDEAHNNYETIQGGYKPLADLLVNDGYRVLPNKDAFQKPTLEGCSVLIIANAVNASKGIRAFTEQECTEVAEWVRGGGSLLLVVDHSPFDRAARILSDKFGVKMSGGTTLDEANADPNGNNAGWIVFSRENGLLAEHPITVGRNDAEAITSVTTFEGQSLLGPEGSIAFLRLAESAVDSFPMSNQPVSVEGSAQGIAFQFGDGKVVVLGDSSMFSARLSVEPEVKVGMNREGNDNKQLALNILHWLSELFA